MGFGKPPKVTNWDEMNKVLQDLYNNYSASDLKGNDVRETAPTSESLEKTRRAVLDDGSSAPVEYYRARNGTVYKLTWVPA